MTESSREREEARGLPLQDPLGDLEESQDLLDGLESRSGSGVSHELEQAEEWSTEHAFRALTEVATSVASNLDLVPLVREILEIALSTIGASRGILFLGQSSEELTPMTAVNVEGSELLDLEQVSRTLLREATEGHSVLTSDALADDRLRDVPSIQLHQIRAVICVPLMNRGECTGVVYLDNPTPVAALPRHTQRFIQAFAGLAAVAIDNARLHGDTVQENVRLKRRVETIEAFGRIVTVDERMRALLQRAAMVAKVDFPALVLGESGTGKELLARAIHEAGPRALQPFIAYNCAAVPPELMESLFFGQVRGAFTGAVRDTPGLFRQADGGVLFLDEIAELDIALQAKLLRCLQDGVVRPLGSEREYPVDVRFVAATSRDLAELVRQGRFREDLYYRLNVLELQVPPLRDRRGDIPLLVSHFLTRGAGARHDGRSVEFTPDALDYLSTLPWRGNIRELESFVYRACVFAESARVGREDVVALRGTILEGSDSDPARESTRDPARPATETAGSEPRTLEEIERHAILDALRRAGGNKSKAARFLGLHRNSLLRRLERLGIDWKD